MKDVCVKAKAKLGKLPNEEVYLALASTGNLEEKLNILSRLYPSIDYRRGKRAIEDFNFRAILNELKSIDYFLEGHESDFFRLYFSKYEIMFVQELIESLVNDNFKRNFEAFISNPLGADLSLDPSMDLESFIFANKASSYYRILVPFINRKMDRDSMIFLSSNQLVKFYYRSLLKLAKKFNRKARANIEYFLGEEINFLNFEMLYRLKTFYNIDDNEIFNYLIEGGNKFNGERLRKLAETPRDEFLDQMSTSKYKDLFRSDVGIHKEVRRQQLKLYRSELRKEETDILYVISAMNMLFLAEEDVAALLELDESFSVDERMEYIVMR